MACALKAKLNGTLKRTVNAGANRAFRAYLSVHDQSEVAVTSWNFSPMGGRGSTGPKGPAGAKGAKGSAGVKFTYSSGVLKITS